MTKNEFQAWTKETQESAGRWQVDEVTLHNTGTLLIYIGGTNGKYAKISKDGKLSVGTYEGAVPHIGEALFKQAHTRNFATQSAAFVRACELLGRKFLRDVSYLKNTNLTPCVDIDWCGKRLSILLSRLGAVTQVAGGAK